HEPGGVALQLPAVHVGDALVQAERGHGARVRVGVGLQGFAAQGVHDVVAEGAGLPQGVLGVGGALLALLARGEVGDGGGVSGGPRVGGALDGQLGGAPQPAPLVARQVGGGEDGVRFDAGRPDDGAGGEAGAVAEDGDAVGAGLQAGLQADVDVAAAQLGDRVAAHFLTDLREDAVGRLHEHPLHVLGAEVVVVPGGVAGHVLQLAEGLDPRVAAADEHEGEGGVAERGVAGGRGDVHLFEDVVAQPDGLLDGLEPDRVLGEPGDRQGARDGAGGEHQVVVGQLLSGAALLVGGEGGDGGGAPGVVDGGGLADDDAAPVEYTTQGYDDVRRGNGPGGRFREEGLVRHVGVRGDDGDLGLAPAEFPFQLPLQAQSRVHPDVAATDN